MNAEPKKNPIEEPTTASKDAVFRRRLATYLFTTVLVSIGAFVWLIYLHPEQDYGDPLLALGSAAAGGLITTLARVIKD